jgi:Uma2 family endonuclease
MLPLSDEQVSPVVEGNAMPVSYATYEKIALEDPEGRWELVCGRLRSKPGTTVEHESTKRRLLTQLVPQLGGERYEASMEGPRLRVAGGSVCLPDLCVVPREFVLRKRREAPGQLEVYDEPMPLVVEVWSPSTGDYDVEAKLLEYQRRGDLEIWRIHPYEQTLTAWRRRADGGYDEPLQQGGSAQPVALPGVIIELDRLFD